MFVKLGGEDGVEKKVSYGMKKKKTIKLGLELE